MQSQPKKMLLINLDFVMKEKLVQNEALCNQQK